MTHWQSDNTRGFILFLIWQLDELQDKYSNLVAEAGIAKSQIEAMQTSRPKTARPKTPQVSTLLSLFWYDVLFF